MDKETLTVIESYRQQVELLLTVIGHIRWQGRFALMGGAAFNLFYEDMPRVPADIDLIYLPINSRGESLKDTTNFLKQHKKEFSHLGFDTRTIEKRVPGKEPLIVLRVTDQAVSVEVEPNFLKGVLLPVQIKPLSTVLREYFKCELNVPCMDYTEIMASKFKAMLERRYSQDIFDAFYFIKKGNSLKSIMDLLVVYLIIDTQLEWSRILQPGAMILENRGIYGITQEIDVSEVKDFMGRIVSNINENFEMRHKEFLISFLEGDPQWGLMPYEQLQDLPSVQGKLHKVRSMPQVSRYEEILRLKEFWK